MDILIEYKNVKEGQLVINQGNLAIVRYISVDLGLEEKYPEMKDTTAIVRMTLLNNKGIPFADTSMLYNSLQFPSDIKFS
jgi:hypothetical protein